MENIGERIRDVRELQGIGKAALAREAGIAYSTFCSIEYGYVKNPSAISLWRIAKALDIPFGVLIGDTDGGKGSFSFLPKKYADALIKTEFLPFLSLALRMYEGGVDPIAFARIIESMQDAVQDD